MKKLLFSLFSILLVTGISTAQEDPSKAAKKAGRALVAYNTDTKNNFSKLEEARDMIEIAAADGTVGKDASTMQTRGEIYATFMQKDVSAMVTNPSHTPEYVEEGMMAVESFKKALEYAEKKYQTRDALKELTKATKNLNFMSNPYITDGKYAEAYPIVTAVLEANQVLMDKGGEPALATEDDINNQKYLIAFTAEVAGEKEVSRKYFTDLYNSGFEEPGVYSRYFNFLLNDGNKDEALKVLEAGREKFPDDTEILFAEINYYIQTKEYEALETKLKQALDKAPENASIRYALGNVYTNLYETEFKNNGDTEVAQGYFDNALKYYNESIKLDDSNVDAIYSIGSLYYNKAVEMINEQNQLTMSKEDQKKYEVMGNEIKALFQKALPFFQDSEKIDPNDTNTLQALSQIYARENNFELSGEFKKRLETAAAGTNKSYFKNK